MEPTTLVEIEKSSYFETFGTDFPNHHFDDIYEYFDFLNSYYLEDTHQNAAITSIIIAINTIIIIVGVLGNLLIIASIARSKKMHRPTYIMIGNIAFSDIIMTAVCLPFSLTYSFQENMEFGDIICGVVPALRIISVCVSSASLTAIAISRYYVIVHPMKKRLSTSNCIIIIIIIWLVAIILAVPLGMFTKREVIEVTGIFKKVICSEQWETHYAKTIYDIFMFLLQCVLPLVIIGVLYTRILIHVNNRVVPGVRTENQHASDMKKKLKMTKMLVSVIIVFAIGWLPLNIWFLTSDFSFDIINNKHFSLLYHIFHALAMCTTCINVFMYGFMNETF
ncbi:neuropeptide Y receptor type 2-like, partial [Saccoglossus kowalevskii]|uniref:Neuropeptide Y receptor type 2-like n=1 Tax=Saccoglossus kowalevskii TaxID=10224 RepID=A0ABM0GZN6_SACKO